MREATTLRLLETSTTTRRLLEASSTTRRLLETRTATTGLLETSTTTRRLLETGATTGGLLQPGVGRAHPDNNALHAGPGRVDGEGGLVEDGDGLGLRAPGGDDDGRPHCGAVLQCNNNFVIQKYKKIVTRVMIKILPNNLHKICIAIFRFFIAGQKKLFCNGTCKNA